MEYRRVDAPHREPEERVRDWREFEELLPVSELEVQAARCMDCGIPFCHSYGCPVRNRIPDWNDMVYRGQWKRALDLLHSTCNFPEVTGRICPAPCEAACTLGINQPAVTIRQIELQIVERGWREGWIVPKPPPAKSGKRVAVIGSGPAGLACAQQLARRGHDVIVFEKADRIGGILRYGIPDFKLEKSVIDRRLAQLAAEGVVFETNVNAGEDISVNYLRRTFDAVALATGSGVPRDLPVPGRELAGIHMAMDFLVRQNRRNAGDAAGKEEPLTARGKHVVVVGGGDTGADCVGTSRRQGAKSITQVELLPQPPSERVPSNPWPTWPQVLRANPSHEEGCERLWSIGTKEFLGEGGAVRSIRCAKLEWGAPDPSGRAPFREAEGSEFRMKAELVLLAMGFVHAEHGPLVKDLGLALDGRGNLAVDGNGMTSAPGFFAAGDAVSGASLIVRSIDSGRKTAASIDAWLGRK
jgi:NAD(P)H-dependent glutamate synthase small subunit